MGFIDIDDPEKFKSRHNIEENNEVTKINRDKTIVVKDLTTGRI